MLTLWRSNRKWYIYPLNYLLHIGLINKVFNILCLLCLCWNRLFQKNPNSGGGKLDKMEFNSNECNTNLWNFQEWSFIFSGISESKVKNLKISGVFFKRVSLNTSPFLDFSWKSPIGNTLVAFKTNRSVLLWVPRYISFWSNWMEKEAVWSGKA